MNAIRSQIEQFCVSDLREQFHEAVAYTVRTGKIPPVFAGDPTFEDAVAKRRKAAETTSGPGPAG